MAVHGTLSDRSTSPHGLAAATPWELRMQFWSFLVQLTQDPHYIQSTRGAYNIKLLLCCSRLSSHLVHYLIKKEIYSGHGNTLFSWSLKLMLAAAKINALLKMWPNRTLKILPESQGYRDGYFFRKLQNIARKQCPILATKICSIGLHQMCKIN